MALNFIRPSGFYRVSFATSVFILYYFYLSRCIIHLICLLLSFVCISVVVAKINFLFFFFFLKSAEKDGGPKIDLISMVMAECMPVLSSLVYYRNMFLMTQTICHPFENGAVGASNACRPVAYLAVLPGTCSA